MIAGMPGDRPVHSVSDAPTLRRRRVRLFLTPSVAALALLAPAARTAAQPPYTLDDSGSFIASPRPDRGTDEALMADARAMLAAGRASDARSLLDDWLDIHAETDNPYLADAYFLRGDA